MVKMGIIATYMNDMGRQRITKYVSKKFEKNSKMSKQFNKEMHKIKELTKKIASENEENMKNKTNLQPENEDPSAKEHENDQTSQKFYSDDQVNQIDVHTSLVDKDKSEDKDADAHRVRESAELKSLFYTVNRILHKYRLSKFRSKYKCTSSQSLLKITISNDDTKEQRTKTDASIVSIQQIANDAKATSFYNSIKTNLTAQKLTSASTGNGDNEIFGFMEVVKNNEKKNISNITYRYRVQALRTNLI